MQSSNKLAQFSINKSSFAQTPQQSISFKAPYYGGSAYHPFFKEMMLAQFAIMQEPVKLQLINPDKMMLMLNFQKNLQEHYAKSQASDFPRFQNAHQTDPQISPKTPETPTDILKYEDSWSDESDVTAFSPLCDSNKSTKAHLKDILYFITENTNNEKMILVEKFKYRNNAALIMVFDALLARYACATMTNEEMVAYIFVKALKHMKLKIKREAKKQMTNSINFEKNKRFLSTVEDLLNKAGGDREDLDSPLKLKPCSSKRESKGAIINQSTLLEAFSSEEFCDAYQDYLLELESILELENNRKFEKFICQIEKAIKSEDIDKEIKKYKKMPWLRMWTHDTLALANDMLTLLKERSDYAQNKIVKKEEYDSSSEAIPSSLFQAKIEANLL